MTPSHRSHLILGGVRSGKSRAAVAEARSLDRPTVFIATARPEDDDMRVRIARHRCERPAHWATIEEPMDLPAACRTATRRAGVVVVDCLTVWVSNLLAGGADDAEVLRAADDLAELVEGARAPLIVVSNEVGLGVHPSTPIGLRFRDLLGAVNQRVAAAADRVTLMVAGLPVEVKQASTCSAGESPHERAPEAP